MKQRLFGLCLLFLLLLPASVVFSQVVSGTVLDAKSSQPLSGANVYEENSKKGTVTDAKGHFNINVSSDQKEVELKISYIGYKTIEKSVKIKNENELIIYLSPEAFSIGEVVISEENEGREGSGYRVENGDVGIMGKRKISEIPYSVQVVSQDLIDSRQAKDIITALNTNPEVVASKTPNNDERGLADIKMRGFAAAVLLNGLPVNSYHMPFVEMADRIEVLSGFSSFFYGFSGSNGVVNYVSKKAPEQFKTSFSTGIYNGGVKYLHTDVGSPVDKNKKVGFRCNAYLEDGNTFVDGQTQKRLMFSGLVSYKIAKNTSLTVEAFHQTQDMTGQQAIFEVKTANDILVPDAGLFDLRKLYGQKWTSTENEYSQIAAHFKSDVNEHVSFRAGYSYAVGFWDYNYLVASFTDNNGNYSLKHIESAPQDRDYQAGYAFADFHAKTGFIKHDLSIGYNGNFTGIHFGNNLTTNMGSFNISQTEFVAMPDTAEVAALLWDYTNYNTYLYNNFLAGDYLKFANWLSVFAGVNYAVYETHRTTGNLTQSGAADYTQSKFSPTFSLIINPVEKMTLYASYIEGLKVGGTAPAGSANETESLKPSSSAQYEAGLKYNLRKIDLYASVFNINVINEYVDPADNVFKQDGRQVHKGIDLSASGKIVDDLTVAGGFTLMNIEIVKADNNPELVGKTPQDVPESQAKLFAEYHLPWVKKLALYGTGSYCGQRPVDALNKSYIEGVALFDFGVRYSADLKDNRKISLNLLVNNVADKKYFTAYYTNGLRLGSPRVLSVSVKFEL